jgi:uroporphyrinogen III methyltransferase/synthase
MTEGEHILSGVKIVVTRARDQATKLADELEALGAEIIEFPCIEIHSTVEPLQLDPTEFDWIIFTSANAVWCLYEKMEMAGQAFDFRKVKLCAVGPSTSDALEDLGLDVNLIPEVYTAEGIINDLTDTLGKKILLPQGDIARPFLAETLEQAGAIVTPLVVYETRCPEANSALADEVLNKMPNWITLTSGSTARNFVDLMGAEHMKELKAHAQFASIGPQTSKEAEEAGLSIAVQPKQHDVEGLVAAISNYSKR